jgi:hypothetical protein
MKISPTKGNMGFFAKVRDSINCDDKNLCTRNDDKLYTITK